MRVLVIGGVSRSLVNFRGKMLESMVAAGHDVFACSGEVESDVVEQLKQIGVVFHAVELERRGTCILNDFRYLRRLKTLIDQVKPDIVLGYTVKPVVYGSIAAWWCKVPLVAAMITGAGAAQPGRSIKQSIVGRIARWLYAIALRHVDVIFFQNANDEAMFRRYRLIRNSRVVQIAGSGVDNDHFRPADPVTEPFTFLLIARLLINKGVLDFASAAKSLKQKYGESVRFVLVGPFESGSGGISRDVLCGWQRCGCIDYLGSLDDVRDVISRASVYVLPSYREGTPRTVLEAMAMGRPVITTDVPGCRETVLDGENGYLVPVRDPTALANAMERFIEHPASIAEMGRRGREIALLKYDVNKVNAVILNELGL